MASAERLIQNFKLHRARISLSCLSIYAFLALCFLIVQPSLAQNQKLADSLLNVLEEGHFDDSLRLDLLKNIAIHSSDPSQKILIGGMTQKLARKVGANHFLVSGLYSVGVGYRLKGELTFALESLFEGAVIAEEEELWHLLGQVYGEIATCYSANDDSPNALLYNDKAINALRKAGNQTTLAILLLNNGYDHYLINHLDTSLSYYEEAEKIFSQIDLDIGLAYTTGNRALVYWQQGENSSAIRDLALAIDMLKPLGDRYGIADYHHQLGSVYLSLGDVQNGMYHTKKGLEIANDLDLKEQIRDASLKLSELFELQGNIDSAYHFHKQYVAFRDSINNEETIQEIADLRTEYEVGQKQAEVDVLTAQQKTERVILAAIASLAVVLLILGLIVYKYYKQKSRVNQELQRLNQTKDKFFSIISHDLRGPVSSFMGISRLIKFMVQAKETDQLLEVADDIDESVERLSALLDNLLNWAMQQQGHFPNVPEKVDLKELSDDLVKTLHTMAKGKQITLEYSVSSEINLWVDRNTTMTILRNLVNNALKFTPEGGHVTIKAKQVTGVAEIKVTDTGVGIPQDKLDSLFRLEDRKSTFGTSGEKGLGLGLQLVYEFIEMNHGSIRVDSEEGKGTTFTVRLPIYETGREPEPLVHKRSETIE